MKYLDKRIGVLGKGTTALGVIKYFNKIKKEYVQYENIEDINEENIDENLKKLTKMKKRFSLYQRFLEAFERDLDIDPGRLMGLTDGIFSIVMTLLIFGMALPETRIINNTGLANFLSSIAPLAGVIIISFIVLASFWIYHHEFIKIKKVKLGIISSPQYL